MSNPTSNSSTGIPSNVAGVLCYVLGPVTGLIFFLIEKEDRFVRFHAAHSIVVGIAMFGLFVVSNVLAIVLQILPILGVLIGILIWLAVGFGSFALWIFMMFQAFSGREWEVPVVGQYARRLLATPAAH